MGKQQGADPQSAGCVDVLGNAVYENGSIGRTTLVFQNTVVEGRVRFGQPDQMRSIDRIEDTVVSSPKSCRAYSIIFAPSNSRYAAISKIYRSTIRSP
jgi:hypothetical protein